MKLLKKLLEILPIGHLADGETRKALTNEAQEIDGLKTFTGLVKVKRDVCGATDSLITLADADEVIGCVPVIRQETITLTAEMLESRRVELSTPAAVGYESQATMHIEGGYLYWGGYQFDDFGTVDFTLNGTILIWKNDYVSAEFMVGDELIVKYYAIGGNSKDGD